jgi:hypothetical protein
MMEATSISSGKNVLEAMRGEVAALVEPSRWPSDLDAEFFLWIPERDTAPRRIFTPSDGRLGWFDERDGDGSIRADLETLGEVEDEVVGNREAALLLELRLGAAGVNVTLDEYPGGHTTLDKVPELIGYLRDAASR